VKTHPALFVSVALTVSVVCAQEGFRGGMSFAAPRFPMQAVSGAPYSGEHVMENDQPLADGTHIRHSKSMKVFRDSAGRLRTEWPLPDVNGREPLTLIQISDPVSHSLYVLDTINKVAHRQELRVAAAEAPPVMGPSHRTPGGNGRPEIVDERLGTRVMEGVEVEGTRHTTIRPVGEMGNDHPMTEVDETWRSPELALIVFHQRTDPRIGEVIEKVIAINRSEPEAALFQVPADYTVVDEAGSFTLNWGR
jgi:hypothetical protein